MKYCEVCFDYSGHVISSFYLYRLDSLFLENALLLTKFLRKICLHRLSNKNNNVWLTSESKIMHEYEKVIMSCRIMVRQRALIFHQLTCSMRQLKTSSKYYRNVIPISNQQTFHNIHKAQYSVCWYVIPKLSYLIYEIIYFTV